MPASTPLPPEDTPAHDSGAARESTLAQLQRLSERLGVQPSGDLSEREARRRIILLREAENS